VTASTIELAASPSWTSPAGIEADRRDHGRPSRLTLEDLVLGAWDDLTARGRAECPVCRGSLEPAGCTACGSQLS
jgi:hypothetical protein